MNLASLVLSALSLIAVSLVGWHSWHLGRTLEQARRAKWRPWEHVESEGETESY